MEIFHFAPTKGNPFQTFHVSADDIPDEYPQYPLQALLPPEKMILRHQLKLPVDKIRAFSIANQAEIAYKMQQFGDCYKMAMHAIKIDPFAIDAYRTSVMGFDQYLEIDQAIKILALREVLYFARFILKDLCSTKDANFYDDVVGRPYLRTLSTLAYEASKGCYFETTLNAYEEHLRLCVTDNTKSRANYTATFLDAVLATKRGEKYFAKRTEEQFMKIFTEKFDYDICDEPESVWGNPKRLDDERIYRYSIILLKYANKDPEWQTLAKKELKRDPQFIKYILFEEKIQCDPMNIFDKNSEYYSDYNILGYVFVRENRFLPDLCKLLRGRVSDVLKGVKEMKENISPLNVGLPQWERAATNSLNEARDAMKKRNFLKAIESLNFTRDLYSGSVFPSQRIDRMKIPFAVFSNRAQCAAQLGIWNLSRIDIRIALTLNPKIPHLYKLLPNIADHFCCPKMKKRFSQFAEEAAKEHIDAWWQATSKQIVGLLSLKALMGERLGLTESQINEAAEIGIDDLYTPISLPPEFKLLPWQKVEDLELTVK